MIILNRQAHTVGRSVVNDLDNFISPNGAIKIWTALGSGLSLPRAKSIQSRKSASHRLILYFNRKMPVDASWLRFCLKTPRFVP